MNEDVLKNLQSEFKLWGVKPQVNYMNSGHIELVWHATPDKPFRRYIIPKTGSDWRGWLNARSKIRQLFKADGLKLVEHIKKEAVPKPAIVQALSLPEPVERDIDQIKLLRAEVGDLSELLLNMMTMVKELIAATPPAEVPQFQPPPAPIESVVSAIKASPEYREAEMTPSVRSIKAIDFVGTAWNSTDALARDMGLPSKTVYMKLNYLMNQGLVERQNGRWRKRPEVPEPVVIAETEKPHALNGHRKH